MRSTLLVELKEVCKKYSLSPEDQELLAKEAVQAVQHNLHFSDPESLQEEIKALTEVIDLLQQDVEKLMHRMEQDREKLNESEARLKHIKETVEAFFTAQLDRRPVIG
jgi:peptidoglycan hydrolase CwlO-like protein